MDDRALRDIISYIYLLNGARWATAEVNNDNIGRQYYQQKDNLSYHNEYAGRWAMFKIIWNVK